MFDRAPKAQIVRELALALGAREAGEIASRPELVGAPDVACVGQPGRDRLGERAASDGLISWARIPSREARK